MLSKPTFALTQLVIRMFLSPFSDNVGITLLPHYIQICNYLDYVRHILVSKNLHQCGINCQINSQTSLNQHVASVLLRLGYH